VRVGVHARGYAKQIIEKEEKKRGRQSMDQDSHTSADTQVSEWIVEHVSAKHKKTLHRDENGSKESL
jgi:hypothetical protein